MNKDEHAILELALLWHPFGGPPDEEIFVKLGITRPQFRERVHRILASPGTPATEPMRRHARACLRTYENSARRSEP